MDKFCEHCGGEFPARRSVNRFCSKSCWARHRAASTNSNWRGGKSKHPLYHSYNDMVARCTRPTHHAYARYGGRGITVCDHWRNDFWAFVADVGERPEGHSLDRIDNDGPYSPDNCQWATASQQSKNRRTQGWEKRQRNPIGQFEGKAS